MAKFNFKACPGINKLIRPTLSFFTCPFCGGEVEIWSDEPSGICDSCNKNVPRPNKEVSCLDWCEYADKCKEFIDSKK